MPTVDALQAGVPDDPSSLITMDVGTPGVRVLLIKSLRAESETNPSGVIGQEQQEISCSSGENVYTFVQMTPVNECRPLTPGRLDRASKCSRVGGVDHRIPNG